MKKITLEVPDETRVISVTLVGGWDSNYALSMCCHGFDSNKFTSVSYDGNEWKDDQEGETA